MFRQLEEGVAVSPQISIDDVQEAKRLGYGTIVCNRPDNEDAGQPSAAAMETAAQDAGLSFLHVPVGPDGVHPQHIDAMAAALEAPGKTLAYCRSGTRSATLWAMARARGGAEVDGLIEAAKAAGYDLSAQRNALLALQ
ncbi:TIGR01244 family sulfur transferase [Parvularcula oceani]|uniref:TIGR01244 family sulfur transferase n=1 Tax=Parvularcula oceani TaxID=1247963 RepID=UPI0004E180B2|nr:TIGR01244 family sulfur transferase [Parvularcula oceani]